MICNWLPFVLLCALPSSALKLPLTQSKQRRDIRTDVVVTRPKVLAAGGGDNGNLSLATANDLIYVANITIGGTEYPVQLDTGSSDLWIMGASFPLPNVNHTSNTRNLTYGIGWAFGNISTATVQFAGLSIPSQAFIDASSASNPALGYSADGILGLGFTRLSTIDSVINKTGASWGRSCLYNAFLTNPQEPNFITFALQRSDDPNDDVQGTFTIGEVNPNYTAISNTPKLPTWPVNSPKRWNVLLDSYIVGTRTFNVSTNVTDAPSGYAVTLLDSGTSYTYCPTEVANNIYSGIPGAQFDPTSGLWSVPCNAEIDMALQFGGKVIPLHPLDVVPQSSSNKNSCVGSFVPQTMSVGGNEFDWLIGDNVLRSLYSLYDFGDFDSNGEMGDPYVQLLPIVDPNKASAAFVALRGGTARTNITYNATPNSASSDPSSLSISDNVADKLGKLVDYIPAILGILALNALALLVISVVAIVFMCRRARGSGSNSKGTKKGRSGVQLNARTPTPYPGSPSTGAPTGVSDGSVDAQGYQRVSVLVPGEPEDPPFTPPEPSFQGYDGDSLSPLNTSYGSGTRPRSMWSMGSESSRRPMLRDHRVSTAGSDMTAFVPPSPKFMKDGSGNERPKSVA